MKKQSILMVLMFVLTNPLVLFAQKNPYKIPVFQRTHRLQKMQSASSVNALWDLKIIYKASLSQSDQSNASATYIPYLKEIWSSHWNNNLFYRWTTKGDTAHILDSVFTFTVNGVTNIRGLTCDEFSVYAANNSDTIFIINPVDKVLEGTIIAPQSVRYITYDPTANQGSGGFWIGNFNTDPQLIDYDGNVLRTLLYSNLGTTNIYGAAYDNISPNGPFLWVFGQTTGVYHYPQEISQVNLISGNATGIKRDVNLDLLTYTDSTLAGGMFIANGLYPGKLILGGILQGTTDILFGYEIASTSFTATKAFSFGDPQVSSSYRIISIPGDISIPVSQIVASAGSQKKDWNFYYDNGQTENYLVEYNNSAIFTFKPGNAFWALSRNSLNISKTVNNVTPDIRNEYSIPLHAGWNLISNPFNKAVSWANIQKANRLGVNELVYAWNGSWSNPQVLNTFEGYYYNNINNLTSLIIPVSSYLPKSTEINDYDLTKFIKVTLCQGDSEYATVYAAQNPNSLDDYDPKDYFSPPSDFSLLNLCIRNSALRTQYKRLFIDSRPVIIEGLKYNLSLKNSTGQKIKLKVSGQEDYNDYEIFLVNELTRKSYDLKNLPSLELEAFNGIENFTLLIGSEDYIAKAANNALPVDYSLSQNYPNPFNPSTTINYELPQRTLVELKIYDILGKPVSTLVKEEQAAGKYEVKFEAKNLSSGLYIYKLTAGNFIQIRKMLLLK